MIDLHGRRGDLRVVQRAGCYFNQIVMKVFETQRRPARAAKAALAQIGAGK